MLVAQCYSCHAADSKEIKGGLALDTREGIRKGGDSGQAVVPGDVKASLLIAAIRHEDGLEMPPKQKLADDQFADFFKWIETGAIDPRDGAAAKTSTAIDIEKGRQFWAFQRPVKPVLPTVKDQSWTLTDIDRFVRGAQEKNNVTVGDQPSASRGSPAQERLQLLLRPRLRLPITGRLGMRQNLLQRVPAQMILLAGRTLTQLARQHLPTDLFPKLHVASHS